MVNELTIKNYELGITNWASDEAAPEETGVAPKGRKDRRGMRPRRIGVDHDEVVRLYKDGLSVDSIGARLGYKGASIRHYLQREGVMPRCNVGCQLRQAVQKGFDRGSTTIVCEWPPRRGGRE